MWDVEEKLREADMYRQLDWWLAFDRLEPIGPLRDDLRIGLLGSTLGNLWASGNPFSPSDFLLDQYINPEPVDDDERAERDAQLQIARVRQIVAAKRNQVGK